MNTKLGYIALGALILCTALLANLSSGATTIHPGVVLQALIRTDPQNYDHYIILHQRLPRALIAIFAGAMTATAGTVLQALTRNPLASPGLLGINAGATLFVVLFGFRLSFPESLHGILAFAGGISGFASCVVMARLAGNGFDPRNLTLILAGAMTSILYSSIANALLLSDPGLRMDLLGWITGNINHVYFNRLELFWFPGAAALIILWFIARPLMLVSLGAERAASAGTNVRVVQVAAIFLLVLTASSAVAVCGPVGFIGLIVPHMVRPFVGASLQLSIPASALTGAASCLLADSLARSLFAPYVLHTGIILECLGGVIFLVIVRRHYLKENG